VVIPRDPQTMANFQKEEIDKCGPLMDLARRKFN
jgi:hypothetical protein